MIGHTLSDKQYLIMEVTSDGWLKIKVEDGTVGWIYGEKTKLEVLEFKVKDVTSK